MNEFFGGLVTGIIVSALFTGLITHEATIESMQKKAVNLGAAEYYIDQDYNRQFRYKEEK